MKLAIVQKAAIVESLSDSIVMAGEILAEAKKEKCDLVVFGENWLCGYPAWIDYCSDVSLWDHAPVKDAWASIYKNSLVLGSVEMNELQSLIKENGMTTVMGANEVILNGPGNGSIYNACFIFNGEGKMINHHRKLIPTHTERLVHTHGDGHGLESVATPFGRLGALICWEHWMPLTRQAMHDASEDIHIALWPQVKEMNIIAARQYAYEGRCYVVSVGTMLAKDSTPKGLNISETKLSKHEVWALKGGSCIVGPNGQIVLEPQYDNDGVIYFEIPDFDQNIKEKMNLAVSGHYQRPDVFDLNVNKRRLF